MVNKFNKKSLKNPKYIVKLTISDGWSTDRGNLNLLTPNRFRQIKGGNINGGSSGKNKSSKD